MTKDEGRGTKDEKYKTALITGASSGIGMSLAKVLAENHYHLILMARRESLMTDWAQFIQTQHPDCKIKIVSSDVSKFEKHMTDVQEVAAEFDSLDLVVANAGIGFNTNEWENTWEGSKQIFDVNLYGAVATIEAAKDIMLKQGHGHIVGISSMASVRGAPQVSAYAASKSALSIFLESMRIDVKQKNITVLDVHPGFVETPMTEHNTYMPFLVSSEKAANIIFKAIQKKRARLFFPWQMLVLNYLSRVMPHPIYDLIMRFSRKKIEGFRSERGQVSG